MTKEALKKECQRILYSYSKIVTSVDDFNFLIKLFKFHPEWEFKSQNSNIIQIETGTTQEYKTKCFYIIREDNTKTDISFMACINGKPSPKQEIAKACRDAIDTTIIQYKKDLTFPITCPITKSTLFSLEEIHIDHYDQPFDDVVKAWIKDKGGEKGIFQFVNDTTDNNTSTCFTSESIKQNFIQYHNTHTHLRAVSKKANLSILKRKQL